MSLPVQVPSHCVQNKARLCVIVYESESGKCQFFSRVQLFMIPWTVVYQVPYPWESPGKNTGLGCHSHLQEILSTQGLNPGLLPCRQTPYYLSHSANSEFMRSPVLIPPYFSTSSHNILSFTYYSQSYSCAVTPQSITKSIPESGPLHVLLLLPETFMPALIFFFNIYLLIFILGCTGSSLLPGLSLAVATECHSSFCVAGFSSQWLIYCRAWTLGVAASVVVAQGLQRMDLTQWCSGLFSLQHVGSSWTTDGTLSPGLAGRFLTTGSPGKFLCHLFT